MLLSIFSNPNIAHLIEIFCWMLGAFLIGLHFGKSIKSKKTTHKSISNVNELEDLNIVDDISKIRATKTFERGGKEMIQTVPKSKENNNGLNFNRIGVAVFEDKDDLQKIKGIGKLIEEKLNAIGIFTFKQISNFNSDDIAKITELISFLQGRIERDDWVGQAYKHLNEE